METKQLVKDFLALQKAYAFTNRKLVTAERYFRLAKPGILGKKDYNHLALQESLTEHVGHLNILAAFFHPHITHSKQVNLGRALTMLAIHDIGETVTGDIFSYDKTEAHDGIEYQHALNVLHKDYHPLLEEYEARESLDAKYAKAIDALAPNIHEVDMPRITIEWFHQMGATSQSIIKKKRKFMEWEPVLLEVFDLVVDQYRRVEEGEELIFQPHDFDQV